MATETTQRPLRDVLRHTFVYGSGYVALAIAGSILVPIYTHRLAPAQYGLLGLILVLYGLMSQVYDFGVTNSVARFFFDAPEDRRAMELVNLRATALSFMAVFGAFLSLLIWIFAKQWSDLLTQSSRHADLVRIVTITLYAEALSIVPLTMIRMQERSRLFVAITFARFTTTLGLSTLFVVVFNLGVRGALLGNAASGVAVLLVLAPEFRHAMRGRPNWVLLRQMLGFGVPFFPVILSAWFIDASDRYLLGLYKGHAQVGYYVLGYKVAQIMQIAVAAFTMGWAPLRYKIYRRPDAKDLYRQITTYYVLAAGVLTVAVAVFSRQIVSLISPPSYASAATIVPLIVLAYALYGMYVLVVTGMGITKRTGPMAWVVGGAAIINVGLNIPLIQAWGMRAAAGTTVLAYAIMVAGGWYYSQKTYPIDYEWSRILRTFVIGVLVVSVTVLMAPGRGIAGLGIALAACAVFVALLVKFRAIAPQDTALVRARLGAMVRAREGSSLVACAGMPDSVIGSQESSVVPMTDTSANDRWHSMENGHSEASIGLRRFPYPFSAALAICNDADLLTPAGFHRLRQFISTDAETEWGPGLQMPIGGSFFMFRSPDSPNGFTVFDELGSSVSADGEFILECARTGALDVLHTYGCFTDADHFNRGLAERALELLDQHGVRIETWVNHGPPTNVQCIGSRPEWQGDLVGSPAYHADLTIQYGVRWIWTGAEMTDEVALEGVPPEAGDPVVGRMLSHVRSGPAPKPMLVMPCTLRDGQEARCFYRYGGLGGRTPVLDDLPLQLSGANLDMLTRTGGYAIVYQHLSVRRVRPGFGPRAYGPVSDAWFVRAEIDAFRRLADRYHRGQIWVVPTTTLLRYRDAWHNMRWQARREDAREVILIDARALPHYSPGVLNGLTFYCECPDTAYIEVQMPSGERVMASTRANPADATGRRSITIAFNGDAS